VACHEIGVSMNNYAQGTLLSCVHEYCPCRIRVEVECTCPDAGEAYRCTCGAEMVAVED
jgi:hypothetical protein